MQQRSIFVIAGVVAVLAIGAALAFNMNNSAPPKFISDAELQKKTEQRSEVKAFLSKYPEAGVQFNRNETIRSIDYYTTVDGNASNVYSMMLHFFTDNSGEVKEVTFTCNRIDGNDVETYVILDQIEEEIENENCLRL